MTLGGEQLYGREPEVAVRELIQNAQDAVLARRAIDPSPFPGHVKVRLVHNENDTWVLEVSDDGLGMDEDILIHALLDFGSCGWRMNMMRTKFVGLTGGKFRPRGRFGIGFFSVFIIADEVELITRRFDQGQAEARRLVFNGRKKRPLLTSMPMSEYVSPGTTVRVVLRTSPYDNEGGIFKHTEDDRLDELICRLIPENDVPIETVEYDREMAVLKPFDLSSASPEVVFDRLYPSRATGGQIREQQRLRVREEFASRATSVRARDGRRIGLAVLGRDLSYRVDINLVGICVVSGFRADEHYFFAGYLLGRPNRASRDNAEFEATDLELQRWLMSQEQRMRDVEDFGQSAQLENAFALHRGRGGTLADDHYIAMVSGGLISVGQIGKWAARREEIIVSQGWPLIWHTRPPRVVHGPTSTVLTLPDGWILPYLYHERILDNVLPSVRDSTYEYARHDRELTWQKMWWRMSGRLNGIVVREICRAWSCEVRDVLGPVADRNWSDFSDPSTARIGLLPVLRLNRPEKTWPSEP